MLDTELRDTTSSSKMVFRLTMSLSITWLLALWKYSIWCKLIFLSHHIGWPIHTIISGSTMLPEVTSTEYGTKSSLIQTDLQPLLMSAQLEICSVKAMITWPIPTVVSDWEYLSSQREPTLASQLEMTNLKILGVRTLPSNLNSPITSCTRIEKQGNWLRKWVIPSSKTSPSLILSWRECSSIERT